MIEYNFKDPQFFLRCIKSISAIADNTVLQFGKRLRTYGMDGSRICLYELVIGESELDIIHDGKINIMIYLTDLQKILARFRNPDELTIIYDQNTITIKGKIANRNKTFKLGILDDDVPHDPMEALNKLALDSVFKMDLSGFLDMIEDAEVYSDSFKIETKDDKIITTAFGNVGESMTEVYLEEGITAEEQCNYALSFAKGILKSLGSSEVTISFAHDKPIMIFDKLSKDSFVRWYLAPRVEQDED